MSETDKRAFFRHDLDANISFHLPNAKGFFHGKTKNLSAGGVQFYCESDVPVGAEISAELSTDEDQVVPLNVLIKIIRSEQIGEYFRISAEVTNIS